MKFFDGMQSEDLPHSSGIKTCTGGWGVQPFASEDLPHLSRIKTMRCRIVGRLAPYWSSGFSDNFKRRPSENAGRNRWYLIAK